LLAGSNRVGARIFGRHLPAQEATVEVDDVATIDGLASIDVEDAEERKTTVNLEAAPELPELE
jgi:hypothetical protein